MFASRSFVSDLGRLVAASADFSTRHLASERVKALAGVALAVVDKTDRGFTCHGTADKRVRIFPDRFINEIVAVIIAARGPLEANRDQRAGSELRVVVGLSEAVGISGNGRSGGGEGESGAVGAVVRISSARRNSGWSVVSDLDALRASCFSEVSGLSRMLAIAARAWSVGSLSVICYPGFDMGTAQSRDRRFLTPVPKRIWQKYPAANGRFFVFQVLQLRGEPERREARCEPDDERRHRNAVSRAR